MDRWIDIFSYISVNGGGGGALFAVRAQTTMIMATEGDGRRSFLCVLGDEAHQCLHALRVDAPPPPSVTTTAAVRCYRC